MLALATFPDTFIECAEYLKPNMMADYSNALADKFNTFYNALPVIKAESPELSEARMALTDAIRTVLSNALSLDWGCCSRKNVAIPHFFWGKSFCYIKRKNAIMQALTFKLDKTLIFGVKWNFSADSRRITCYSG